MDAHTYTMDTRISRTALLNALRRVRPFVASSATYPVLNNFQLIASTNGTLTVSATNLEAHQQYTVGAHVVEPGGTTVPARQFYDWVVAAASTTGEEVIVNLRVEKSSHKLVATVGKITATFKGIDVQEFPHPIPDVPGEGVSFPPGIFQRMIHQTAFVASGEALRPSLTGLHITISEEGKVVSEATDGYVLARMVTSIPYHGDPLNILVPAIPLEKVAASSDKDEPVKLSVVGKLLVITCGAARYSVQLIDLQFPNMDHIVRHVSGSVTAVSPVAELRQAYKIMRATSYEQTRRPVNMAYSDVLVTSARYMVGSSNSTELANSTATVDGARTQGEAQYALDSNQLLRMFNVMGSVEVSITYRGDGEGVLLTPIGGDVEYYVMPITYKE